MKTPVKVLCFFRAWARLAGVPFSYVDSLMIRAERSSDIKRLFRKEINRRLSSGNKKFFSNGPTPIVYELISFLPEHGRTDFNIFRE